MQRRLFICVIVALASVVLSGCAWLECAVLCERFYVQGMTNPKTGEHITCGNWVQKGTLTYAQRAELKVCIVEHEGHGFVLDRPSILDGR